METHNLLNAQSDDDFEDDEDLMSDELEKEAIDEQDYDNNEEEKEMIDENPTNLALAAEKSKEMVVTEKSKEILAVEKSKEMVVAEINQEIVAAEQNNQSEEKEHSDKPEITISVVNEDNNIMEVDVTTEVALKDQFTTPLKKKELSLALSLTQQDGATQQSMPSIISLLTQDSQIEEQHVIEPTNQSQVSMISSFSDRQQWQEDESKIELSGKSSFLKKKN